MGADDAPIILRAHTGPVVDISFSRDGSRLAAASWENAASVWSMADLEPIHTYPLRDRGWSAALSPDGRQLATSDASGDIILWQIDEERSAVLDQLVPLSQYDDPTVTDLAFSPDGTVLAGIGSASSLYLWNLSSTERVELPGRGSWHLQFSADGQFVVTASYSDASVRIWGVPAGS